VTHIDIKYIESQVHASDNRSLVDPRTKHQLLCEFMKHVEERDAHAHRVRRERDVNAGRTTEEIA
jgi:hypothetical protein